MQDGGRFCKHLIAIVVILDVDKGGAAVDEVEADSGMAFPQDDSLGVHAAFEGR